MPVSDLAHLGPVEMFTPAGEASLAFFVDVMGMEIEAQEGPSTYLRCAHDYQRWSLKLTASDTSGMGVLGLRAWSPEALERRVALVEAAGLGEGWTDAYALHGRLHHVAFWVDTREECLRAADIWLDA